MPRFMVLRQTSRCVSSTMIAPSVPTISIQVEEKFGYAGGSTQPAPIVNTLPSSSVTMIHAQSGTLCVGFMILFTMLRIDAHRLSRRKAPEHEIDIVRRFHRGRRELDAPADFVAQVARDVPAHQRADGLADRAVIDRALHVREFGIEALRISDREQQGFRPRQGSINSSASESSSAMGFSRNTCLPASRLSLAIG